MASLTERAGNPASLMITLGMNPGLSTLVQYINSSATLSNLLANPENATFLAPTNEAFTTWLNATNNRTQDEIDATLSYHLLKGNYPTVEFTNGPQFAPTYLTNSSYANVTVAPGGQRVKYMSGSNGQPEIFSNNKTASTIITKDTIFLGGLIQVIDTVLSIPIALVTLTVQANLSYFIAILNKANFLSINDAGLISFVNNVTQTPNITFFIPNSQEALAIFNNESVGISAQNLTDLFNYHIVYDYVGYSNELVNETSLKTAEGQNLTITRDTNGLIYVNQAMITDPDLLIVNGVVHVIDLPLNRFNTSIPDFIPRAVSLAFSNSHSSGLSTGGIVAIAVVIPVVVLAALAVFLFFFFKKRKARREARPRELDANGVPIAAQNNIEGKKGGELPGMEVAKELPGRHERRELDATQSPTELNTPANELYPFGTHFVELE